uniref:Uncharacterized protein n=1 Tax=Anguilla anguilla TaxID=7936 RepID=A0A0E9QQ66_ANGAN
MTNTLQHFRVLWQNVGITATFRHCNLHYTLQYISVYSTSLSVYREICGAYG